MTGRAAARWSLLAVLLAACGGTDEESVRVLDQASAERFAEAVQSGLLRVAPPAEDATWSGDVVQGLASGQAVVRGSHRTYRSAHLPLTREGYDVTVAFTDFADDAADPHLTGTVTLSGTCGVHHGRETTYEGAWVAGGEALRLGGSYRGEATIALRWERAGQGWSAVVRANRKQWTVAY